jgi:membrane protease YdiL (CAAX protease family)
MSQPSLSQTSEPSDVDRVEHALPGAAPREPEPQTWVMLALVVALIIAWCMLIRRFGEGDVYAVIGPYALGTSCLLALLRHKRFAELLRPRAKPMLIGLGVGVAMTALTYPVFQLAVAVFPDLDSNVQSLYTGARSTTLPKALVWIIAAAAAEELLYRGALLDLLLRLLQPRQAYSVCLVTYAVAQLGTGSLIVGLMAAVCGTVWSVQRAYTDSLLSPLIAHLIWTPTVILLYPVT